MWNVIWHTDTGKHRDTRRDTQQPQTHTHKHTHRSCVMMAKGLANFCGPIEHTSTEVWITEPKKEERKKKNKHETQSVIVHWFSVPFTWKQTIRICWFGFGHSKCCMTAESLQTLNNGKPSRFNLIAIWIWIRIEQHNHPMGGNGLPPACVFHSLAWDLYRLSHEKHYDQYRTNTPSY